MPLISETLQHSARKGFTFHLSVPRVVVNDTRMAAMNTVLRRHIRISCFACWAPDLDRVLQYRMLGSEETDLLHCPTWPRCMAKSLVYFANL